MNSFGALVSRKGLVRIFSSAAIGIAAMNPVGADSSLHPSLPVVDAKMNEHIILIKFKAATGSKVEDVLLETTVFEPSGEGPFPVIIMNHGKDPGRPNFQPRDRFYHMARQFVAMGYKVIVPMRQGFSNSTGHYRGDFGCNMILAGQGQADDIDQVLRYVKVQPWAKKNEIIIAGQSFGGLATLALGTRHPEVRGLINFAGGLQDASASCAWRSGLIEAMKDFGGKTSLPSLWIYGQNDSLFGPDLAKRMADEYNFAGGKAKLFDQFTFKRDAHGMLASPDGAKTWLPPVKDFLQAVGMPTDPLFAVESPPEMAETGFAELDDAEAVPHLGKKGREAYKDFLTKETPRAFAVSPSGAWTWAEEGEDPVQRALDVCSARAGAPCQIYAVDDRVVWPKPDTGPLSSSQKLHASIP
jgi:dienelactone hydrolase